MGSVISAVGGIVGGAVGGPVGAQVGSSLGSLVGGDKDARKAAQAQAAGLDAATKLQADIYNQNRDDLEPFRTTGYAANTRLSQLMGLDTFNRDEIAKSLGLERTESQGANAGGTTPQGFDASLIRQGYNTGYQAFGVDPYQLTAEQRRALEPYALGAPMSGKGGYRQEFAVPLDVYNTAATSPNNATEKGYLENELIRWAMGQGGQAAATPAASGATSDIEAQIDAEIARLKGDPAYGSLTRKFSLEDFQADPGYQFRQDEGNKALAALQSKRGNLFSGQAMKEAARYNSDLASQEYGLAFGRDDKEKRRLYDMLGGTVERGYKATGTAIGGATDYANELSGIALARGQNQADLINAQANSRNQSLAGLMGAFGGSSYGWGQSGGPGVFNPNAYASGLPWSDIRLKKDIIPAGEENGHKVYTFRYKGDAKNRLYKGVMAQDVMETNPEAVTKMGNYYAVDYGKLGVKFEEVA